MRRLREAVTRRRLLSALAVVVIIGAVFAAGYLIGDNSAEVSKLKQQVASLEGVLGGTKSQVSSDASEIKELEEAKGELASQLHAERSLNGKTAAPAATTTYKVNYPWMGAGSVGYLTMKPLSIEEVSPSKWVMTIEAKNESKEPKQPFCGSGFAAVADAAGRKYSGASVINGNASTDQNCGEELQPGLTGSYQVEFKLPAGDKPTITSIWGEQELNEDAKTWGLPK